MPLIRRLQKSFALAAAGLLSTFVCAATPAGSTITNQASITFIDGLSGQLSLVHSNVARVQVSELRAMDLQEDHNEVVYAGETINLSHRLSNTGNVADTYALTLTDLAGDNGELINLRLIHDLNGNGLADDGEPEVSVSPRLNAGESMQLVVTGTLPATSVAGDSYQLLVEAQSQTDGSVIDSNTDTLTIDDGARLVMSKQSSQQCDSPLAGGDKFGYDIRFNNVGNQLLDEQTILLDGDSVQGVLIQDRLPYGVHLFKPQEIDFSPVQAVPVVQLFSQAGSDQWIRFSAWDGVAPVLATGLFFEAQYLERNQAGHLAFEVQVFETVTATTILNEAFVDHDNDSVAEFITNEVCNTLAGPNSSIRFVMPSDALLQSGEAPDFFDDDDYQDAQVYLRNLDFGDYSLPRDGVYVELTSTGLDHYSYSVLSDGRRSIVVNVAAELSGDSLNVELQETAPGSGVFRSPSAIQLDYLSSNGDESCMMGSAFSPDYDTTSPECLLLARENDRLTVTFFDQATNSLLDDSAIVDPLGEVFDSSTLLPVEGAIVRVFKSDGSAALDPLTGLPLSPITTRADGLYRYPRMFPGDYYLSVEPPANYSFPSTVPANQLSQKTVSNASYGRDGFSGALNSGVFTLSAANPVIVIDIPLDPEFVEPDNALLIIEKEASVKTVDIGGLVEYTLKIRNAGDVSLSHVSVHDVPPYGFKYISDTTRINGDEAADPVLQNGALVFLIGDLNTGQETLVQYVLQATAGAIDSDGINRAVASGIVAGGSNVAESNEARARVEVRRTGLLSDRAFIFGKIYVDGDCNNIQNDGEWPIGGVKVFMEDGTYAITDENGQYSLYGIRPGMHAVKIDPLTLPETIRLKPIDNRHAADPDSRFVDLLPGEMHRADFAAQCPKPEDAESLLAQLQARNESIQGDWMLEEASRFDPDQQLRREDDLRKAQRTGGDLSHGLIGRQAEFRGDDELNPEDYVVRSRSPSLKDNTGQEESELAMPLTAEVVKTITRQQADDGTWLWPVSDTSYTARFMVVVKAGINPDLYVNGEKVSRAKLGEQIVNKRERAQVLAWYGVELEEGENQLEVKGVGPFGNERVLASGVFKRPARGESLSIEPEREDLQADGGRSTVPVAVKVLDRNGYPAQGVYFVTVEASDGHWVEKDIQDGEPGHQVKIVNGEGVLHLRSSEQTGSVTIRASHEQMTAEAKLVQIAPMRPLVGLGVIDFTWRKNRLSHDRRAPNQQKEEKEGFQSDGRGALLLKGRVMNDYHLTLSYDTDKDDDTELLRDIDPNEYYPIYGDNSVRGFEAQSRDKLYAKLEKGRSSLMWGDYVTDAENGYEDLSRIQRTLTGGRAIYDNGTTRAEVFGAEESDRRGLVEIPGNGTAMLYTLDDAPIVHNSEVIELITRDRDNRGLLVKVESLTRFVDYTIDYWNGSIRFTRSIPTLDDDFNPVFVRISYDLDSDGKEYLIAGGRIQQEITENLTVGGSYTQDEHKQDGYQVGGGFVEYKVGERTRLFASLASMEHEDDSQESGDASYVALEHRWVNGSATRATWGKTEEGFTNNSGGVGSGREETRVEHIQQVTDKLSVKAQVLDSESLESDEKRSSQELTADYHLGGWTLRAGGRAIEQQAADGEDETFNTALVGATRSFTLLDRSGSVGVEYEQEAGSDERKRWLADMSWQAHEKARIYGRYEQINSLTGITGLSKEEEEVRTSFGVESTWLPSTTMYNEYRLEGGIDGRDLEAASGIRGDYELEPGLVISPTFEMIDTLEGERGQDNKAVSLGYRDSRNENSRKIARVEARKSESETYYGLDLNYVARVNEDWSSFIREDVRWRNPDEGDNVLNHTFTLGMARRPRQSNRHHLLFMYQWMEDKEESSVGDRTAHLVSAHSNVEIDEDTIWSGRVGFKHEKHDLQGKSFDTDVWMIDSRWTKDITRRIDLDLHGGILGTNGTDQMRYSLGLGVNYLVRKNLRIGLGYNFTGFEEDDLDSQGYNAQGVHFGIQYKFDEDMFGWLGGDND